MAEATPPDVAKPATWQLLGTFLPRRTSKIIGVALLSAVSGVLEALVLMLVVAAALAISQDGTANEVTVPGLGSVTLDVPWLLVLASVFAVLSAAGHFTIARLGARISAEVLATSRARALRAFANAPWSRQAADREGALQETVSTLSAQTSMLSFTFTTTVAGFMSLGAMLAAAVIVDPVVCVVVVVVAATLFVALRPVSRLTRRRATRFVSSNARFNEQVAEASSLAMEMRVFGVNGIEGERLVDQAEATAEDVYRTRFASRAGANLYRDAAILFMVGAVAVLYAFGGVDLAAVGSIVLLMVRALSYAQQAHAGLQQVHEFSPNMVELDRRLRSLQSSQEPTGTVVIAQVGDVVLQRVSYAYGDDPPALVGVDLVIPRGEQLGIVGPSGSGKSTLVQILLRLRRPTDGTLSVHGRDYTEVDPGTWAHLVSLVPQEPRLFAGTVLDNITYFRGGISRADAIEAAKKAHVAAEIEQLPHGFDTVLGPRGGGLSGGQRQRLAIARALVGQPQLLVLDEPTSALDVHSERLLQQTIAELHGSITMVIVAHRLSTIAACDRLVILDGGRVAAIGTHAEVGHHPFLARAGASS